MFSSSITFCARTFPTPGNASSIADTFIFPRISSDSACSRHSLNPSAPFLSFCFDVGTFASRLGRLAECLPALLLGELGKRHLSLLVGRFTPDKPWSIAAGFRGANAPDLRKYSSKAPDYFRCRLPGDTGVRTFAAQRTSSGFHACASRCKQRLERNTERHTGERSTIDRDADDVGSRTTARDRRPLLLRSAVVTCSRRSGRDLPSET